MNIQKKNINKYNRCIFFTKNKLKLENLKKIEIEPQNELNYLVKYEQKKIKYCQNDFKTFIERNLENKMNKDNISKIDSEILYLFDLIKSTINESHLEIIYKDSQSKANEDLNVIKLLIKNNFKNVIEYQEKEKNIYVYKKVTDNQCFDKYYSKWQIKDDIKGNLLTKLFRYYFHLFKFIKEKFIEKSNFLDGNEIYSKKLKYRPVESLSSFSSMQNLGIWKNINEEKTENFTCTKLTSSLKNLFKDEYPNFEKFLTFDNFLLCLNNIDEEAKIVVLKYFEDLSINYYTILYLLGEKSDESNKPMVEIEKIYKNEKGKMLFGYLRFKLMKNMDFEITNHNIGYLKETEKILEEFIKINCFEGELEAMFAKLYIYLKEHKEKKDEEIKKHKNDLYEEILDKIKKNDDCEIKDKTDFLNIFKCKVKYAFIKYEIMAEKGKIKNEEEIKIQSELDEIAKMFKKEKKIYNEIKTFLLMSELYYVNNKEKFILYLNFALYVALINRYNYKNYIISYADKKKQNIKLTGKMKDLEKLKKQ